MEAIMTSNNVLANLRPLSQDERLAANQTACNAVLKSIGEYPTREQFINYAASKYPLHTTRLIIALCIIALTAAFTPSAIRLYHIGAETFGYSINHTLSQQLVGIAIVLMAEISQVVFSLSLAVLGASHAAKRLLYSSMAIATAIALIGNIQVALPGQWTNPFAWLEAVAPPLLVLSLSYILKEQMLTSIEQRFLTEQAYQQAVAEWSIATAKPEEHPKWLQFYANTLRDSLREANKYKRSINLNDLYQEDWRRLVWREIQADTWYSDPTKHTEDVNLQSIHILNGLSSEDSKGDYATATGIERSEKEASSSSPLAEDLARVSGS
jgi:hypothetical protein